MWFASRYLATSLLSMDSLALSCKWLQILFDRSTSGVPFTLPRLRLDAKSKFRLDTWPMSFKIQVCIRADRRCFMPSSWSTETFERNSVYNTPSTKSTWRIVDSAPHIHIINRLCLNFMEHPRLNGI